jgi:hypothetical protein
MNLRTKNGSDCTTQMIPFKMETKCVYCAIRAEFLNINQTNFSPYVFCI